MTNNPRVSNGNARRKLRSWLRAQRRPCWICRAFGRNGAIDYELPHNHPLAFEVDELDPVSLGGDPLDPTNVDAAHRRCNQWRGNKTVAEVKRIAAKARQQKSGYQAAGKTSRKW